MTERPNELWECANCFAVGDLNIRGRCSRCDSDAVVSLAAHGLNKPVAELERMVGMGRRA